MGSERAAVSLVRVRARVRVRVRVRANPNPNPNPNPDPNPNQDALTCEYMAPLHQQRPLPEQESSFSFDFEKPNVSQEALRELIHAEMLNFHPNSGSEDPK